MEKISKNYMLGLSMVILIITLVFALTSNISWVIIGTPKHQLNLANEQFSHNDYSKDDKVIANIDNFNISYLSSGKGNIFYQSNNVFLLSYSAQSSKLPVLYPTTNILYINVTMWFMTYIFGIQDSSYHFITAINRSVSLNSSHLKDKGSLIWNYPKSNPFTNINERDKNYSLTVVFFESFYVENMTSNLFHYEYATIGLLGGGPNLPTSPNPAGNPDILTNVYPNNGGIFIIKNWSVLSNSIISIFGLSLATILFVYQFIQKRKAGFMK